MAKTYEELLEQAAIVRDETAAGKNTAARVGGALADAVDYVKGLQDFYADIHKQAEDAKSAAAAAETKAGEAKTNSTTALNNAKGAVLTANAAQAAVSTAQSAADAAKAEAEQIREDLGNNLYCWAADQDAGFSSHSDTYYHGLMSAADKEKVDGLDARFSGIDNDVSSIRSSCNALATSVSRVDVRTGFVTELGTYSSLAALLEAAAAFNVVSDPGIAIIHGKYITSGSNNRYSSVIITQQVSTNADGSGKTMQYYAAGNNRYSRYINFTATGIPTSDGVQPAQFDIPRNLVHSGTLLKMTDMYGNNVGASVYI